MKKRTILLGGISLAALLALGYFTVWPLVSPAMSWSRFAALVQAALREQDHAVIALRQRVLAPREEEDELFLHCDENQSLTIVGTGRASGDCEQLLLEGGDFRLVNMSVRCEGVAICAEPRDAGSLSLKLDEHCRVTSEDIAIQVRMRHMKEGSQLAILNAGELRGDYAGIHINNTGPDRVSVINTGTIESRRYGVIADLLPWEVGDDTDTEIEIQNDGAIRSSSDNTILARTGSGGRVTVINGPRGALESAGACIAVSACEAGIAIRNEGSMRAQAASAPVIVNLNWSVAPSALPPDWAEDEAVLREALRTHALKWLATANAAALPVGTAVEVKMVASAVSPQDAPENAAAFLFGARVLAGGVLGPLEAIERQESA